MERVKRSCAPSVILALVFFLSATARAQIDVGDFTITGQAEVGGLPMHFHGERANFEQYRDLPETVIVPQLQFFIGGKKEDYYLSFDSSKTGRADQEYTLRFGRYGILDVEFNWDQIPHNFSFGIARTPYNLSNDGGTQTLSSRPASFATTTKLATDTPDSMCARVAVCQWVNAESRPVDLSIYNGIARFNVKYTPTPGWTFTGTYWSNHNVGKRAFGTYFGPSPGAYNITELMEPINYETNNIELGAQYAGKGWSIGLNYAGSFLHTSLTNLVWDNPIHATVPAGGTGNCVDSATYNNTTGTGPCRGRLDLYPSNQAHTISLTGTAELPAKTRFFGTFSYSWMLQDDSFLPFTINSAITQPSISASSLAGNVQPLMINATMVNNAIERLNLKAYYRFFNVDNNSRTVRFNQGIIVNDQAPAGCPPTCPEAGSEAFPYAYFRQDMGMEAAYDFTRWLNGKFVYNWQRYQREKQDVLTSDEFTIGPIFDIKPYAGLLFRAAYRHSYRDAPNYDNNRLSPPTCPAVPGDCVDAANISRKFYEAQRHQDKVSLFTEFSPWENVSLHAGFEFKNERFAGTLGTVFDNNYSPSIGFAYVPLEWLRFFGDYNFDIYGWKLDAMQRSSTAQNPNNPNPPSNCNPDCVLRLWTSRGTDTTNTVTLGSDMAIIKNLLNFRIQYTFSQGVSDVNASGSTCVGCTPATNYPPVTFTWHEMLAQLEYLFHKNLGLKLRLYFNKYKEKYYSVDIMRRW